MMRLERRGSNGGRMMGPPMANALLWVLDRVERDGMPGFEEGNETVSFRW